MNERIETTAPAAWRYGAPAIALHWALALLIACMAGLGWYMMTVEHDPGGRWYMDLHKSVGLIVFALVLLRVVWRASHEPAPLPPGLPAWQVRLSAWVQGLLYLCMVVMPITGTLGSLYSRAGLAFFGLPIPSWAAPSRETSHLFFDVHSALVWVLVVLVAVHAAAGLMHLFKRDRVFDRMWRRGRPIS